MRLTTRGRYAVTAMIDLAMHNEGGPVTLADISARQGISLHYLHQLFSRLHRQELVDSSRGPGGGYRLHATMDKISVADVISAVDERIDSTRCGGQKNCQSEDRCLTHELWQDLSDEIHQYLARISLSDLVQRQSVRAVSNRQDGEDPSVTRIQNKSII